MRKIVAMLVFCLFLAVVAVSAQTDFCFRNEGLKKEQIVSFTVTGKNIEGTFEVSGYDESSSTEIFEFTGTKSGNLLTIRFQGTIPYEKPPKTSKIVWTLGKKTLQISMYGRDYKTDKFSVYTATYRKCGEI